MKPVEVTAERKVVVRDAQLLEPVVRMIMAKLPIPGDWIWDEATGKGWMRRLDGRIAELTASHVAALQNAEKRGKRLGARAREVVLQAVSR